MVFFLFLKIDSLFISQSKLFQAGLHQTYTCSLQTRGCLLWYISLIKLATKKKYCSKNLGYTMEFYSIWCIIFVQCMVWQTRQNYTTPGQQFVWQTRQHYTALGQQFAYWEAHILTAMLWNKYLQERLHKYGPLKPPMPHFGAQSEKNPLRSCESRAII